MFALFLAGILPDTRMVVATYLTLLLVGLASMIVAAMAACQLAIHCAFAAGFKTGQASVWSDDEDAAGVPSRGRTGPDDPLLRLVE